MNNLSGNCSSKKLTFFHYLSQYLRTKVSYYLPQGRGKYLLNGLIGELANYGRICHLLVRGKFHIFKIGVASCYLWHSAYWWISIQDPNSPILEMILYQCIWVHCQSIANRYFIELQGNKFDSKVKVSSTQIKLFFKEIDKMTSHKFLSFDMTSHSFYLNSF